MASPQAQTIKTLYNGWMAEIHANPDMALAELRGLAAQDGADGMYHI